MKPVIVPATDEILNRFYGKRLPHTIHRALACVLDGEPICIAGAYRVGDKFLAFADMRPMMRTRFAKTGVRLARQLLGLYREMGVPLFAKASCDVEAAGRFLEYLGFKPLRDGVYAWRA